MVDDKSLEWLGRKVNADPEFVVREFVPRIVTLCGRFASERDQANRAGSLEQIKYAQGRLDGAQEALRLIMGMRLSESEKHGAGTPLVSRILSLVGGGNGR